MVKIVIYGVPDCPYCEMTKKYFNNKKMEFLYIDILNDDNAASLIFDKTGQNGVPVININGKYILGYNVSKIEEFVSQG